MDIKVFLLLIIAILVERASEACLGKCTCTKYKTFCRKLTNMFLPNELPSRTELLSMEFGVLNQLNGTIFSRSDLTGLKTLKLIKMQIQQIQTSTFLAMGKLESLAITENNINDLESGAFTGLHNLYTLDLSCNRLKTVSSGVFSRLKRLRHLSLKGNLITRIHSGMFDDLRQEGSCQAESITSFIDLSGNKVTSIEEGAFRRLCFFRQLKIDLTPYLKSPGNQVDFQNFSTLQKFTITSKALGYTQTQLKNTTMQGLHSLTHLNIHNLTISTLPNSFLADSTLLRILKIDYNYLQELEFGCFRGLRSLSELDLSHNSLTHLNNSLFQDLISLKYLDLSYNLITTIQWNSFKGLSHLKFLHISNNGLESLSENALYHLVALRELHLSNNLKLKPIYSVNTIDKIDNDAFSRLFLLKLLRVEPFYLMTGNPHPSELYDFENVSLIALERLDSFHGPISFRPNGLQIMRSLSLNSKSGSVHNYTEKWSKEIPYLKDPINLEIHHLETLTELKSFHKFHISNFQCLYCTINIFENNSFSALNRLKSMTINTDKDLTILQGAFNNLNALEFLELATIKSLYIDHGVFEQLANLQTLILESDFYTEIGLILKPYTFKGLKKLKELVLSVFRIRNLGVGYLIELENLQSLHLKNNFLSYMSAGVFLGLRNIKKIDLSSNSLWNISRGVFGALCNDDFITDCANLTRLTKFCNTSFVLQTLQHLNLGVNEITFIHPHSFLGCNKLQTLILSDNNIHTLDFLYTPDLRDLTFRTGFTDISIISNATFKCSPKLSNIDLKSTTVIDIHLSAFTHLKNLKMINLPFTTCNCRLKEIWQWLNNHQVTYHKFSRQFPFVSEGCNGENIDVYFWKLQCNTSLNRLIKHRNNNSTSNELVYFKNYIEPIVFIFTFLGGCFGNCLLLFVILYHSDMRNNKNACIAHLAIVDIMCLVLNLPLSYWDIVHVTWDLDEATCKIFVMSKDLVVALVVFTVVSLTFERFLVVRTSFNLTSFYGLKDIGPTLLLVIVWIYSVITSIPSYLNATVKDRCLSYPPGREDYIQRTWTFQLIMNCVFPIVSISILNIGIAYTLKKSIRKSPGVYRNESRDKSRNTVANIVMILSAIFILSYLPNFLLRTLVSWEVWNKEDVFWYSFVSYCLFFLHSILNPFCIFTMSSKFRFHIMKYIRFLKEENEEVSKFPNVKKEFISAGLKSEETLVSSDDVGLVAFPHDVAKTDDEIRQARQERLNKLKARFR